MDGTKYNQIVEGKPAWLHLGQKYSFQQDTEPMYRAMTKKVCVLM